MYQVLFVCTGNIFRSLTAEYALRDYFNPNTNINITSAGTDDLPDLMVKPVVKNYLLKMGVDVSSHKRRSITREIISYSDFIIAMSIDHQEYLNDNFNIQAPLFTEACGKPPQPLYDIDDILPEDQLDSDMATQHIEKIIDTIFDLTPSLAKQIKMKL